MKNKHILLSIVSTIVFFNISLSASDTPPSGSFDPVIEISNKGNESIQVNITDENIQKDITTAYVSPGQRWNSGARVIDMNNRLRFEILTQKAGEMFKKGKTGEIIMPKGIRQIYIIDAPGKTKYLSWDPTKSMPLYPQSGPWAGFGKMIGMKTASGLSLDNNVSASQIQPK